MFAFTAVVSPSRYAWSSLGVGVGVRAPIDPRVPRRTAYGLFAKPVRVPEPTLARDFLEVANISPSLVFAAEVMDVSCEKHLVNVLLQNEDVMNISSKIKCSNNHFITENSKI